MIITPPWTQKQVDALNLWQKTANLHPFTCGGNRTDEKHTDGEGILVATPSGWVCPFCGYTQKWAHDFMLHPESASNWFFEFFTNFQIRWFHEK